MSALTTFQKELIDQIADKNGFKRYEIESESGSVKGDNYMGVINTINISELENSKRKLHLILKSAVDNEKLREAAPVRKIYQREIFIYDTVFPAFHRFEHDSGIKSKFDRYAKYYGGSLEDSQECLVLENLRESDFQLWDRMVPMNEEHAVLVFQTYAKFHALSLAMNFLYPEKFQELTKDLKNVFTSDDPEKGKEMMENTVKPIFKTGFDAVAGNEKASKCMQRFAEKIGDLMQGLQTEQSLYRCILHGDCWCNNMLFKYDDDKKSPTEMRLLDWQLSSCSSPILDLTYFLFTNCSTKVMENYGNLLKIYHEAVSETLKEAGCNPEEVFSFETLLQEWDKYKAYGLLMALFAIKIVVSKSEEAVDFKEVAEAGKGILESITTQNSNVEVAHKRIADVVMFYDEHNFI